MIEQNNKLVEESTDELRPNEIEHLAWIKKNLDGDTPSTRQVALEIFSRNYSTHGKFHKELIRLNLLDSLVNLLEKQGIDEEILDKVAWIASSIIVNPQLKQRAVQLKFLDKLWKVMTKYKDNVSMITSFLLSVGIITFEDNENYFQYLKEFQIVDKIKLVVGYTEIMKDVYSECKTNIEYSLKALSNLIHSKHIIFTDDHYEFIYQTAKKYPTYEISQKILLKYQKK